MPERDIPKQIAIPPVEVSTLYDINEEIRQLGENSRVTRELLTQAGEEKLLAFPHGPHPTGKHNFNNGICSIAESPIAGGEWEKHRIEHRYFYFAYDNIAKHEGKISDVTRDGEGNNVNSFSRVEIKGSVIIIESVRKNGFSDNYRKERYSLHVLENGLIELADYAENDRSLTSTPVLTQPQLSAMAHQAIETVSQCLVNTNPLSEKPEGTHQVSPLRKDVYLEKVLKPRLDYYIEKNSATTIDLFGALGIADEEYYNSRTTHYTPFRTVLPDVKSTDLLTEIKTNADQILDRELRQLMDQTNVLLEKYPSKHARFTVPLLSGKDANEFEWYSCLPVKQHSAGDRVAVRFSDSLFIGDVIAVDENTIQVRFSEDSLPVEVKKFQVRDYDTVYRYMARDVLQPDWRDIASEILDPKRIVDPSEVKEISPITIINVQAGAIGAGGAYSDHGMGYHESAGMYISFEKEVGKPPYYPHTEKHTIMIRTEELNEYAINTLLDYLIHGKTPQLFEVDGRYAFLVNGKYEVIGTGYSTWFSSMQKDITAHPYWPKKLEVT